VACRRKEKRRVEKQFYTSDVALAMQSPLSLHFGEDARSPTLSLQSLPHPHT